MADPSSRRKLAAILSADVVGYSQSDGGQRGRHRRDPQVLSRHHRPPGGAPRRPCGQRARRCAVGRVPECGRGGPGRDRDPEIPGRAQHRTRTGTAHAVPHWGQPGRCDRGGRRHDLWGWRQHRRAHGGPRRGRRRLHLLHRLRRRRRQAFLRVRFSGRAAGQEHFEAGPRLPRARRAQATVGAPSVEAPHAMADRRTGLGADPGAWARSARGSTATVGCRRPKERPSTRCSACPTARRSRSSPSST